jgi:Flp pilus assembly protein TadG
MNFPMTSTNGVRSKSRVPAKRLGAAAVEFAVVAPIMILLTMGMIEVGRMVMVKQVMVNASREGARLGTLPGVSNADVTAQVQEALQSASIPGVQITVTPVGLATAPAGTQVTVQLTVPASQVGWVPNPLFSVSKNITTSTTMRRESL